MHFILLVIWPLNSITQNFTQNIKGNFRHTFSFNETLSILPCSFLSSPMQLDAQSWFLSRRFLDMYSLLTWLHVKKIIKMRLRVRSVTYVTCAKSCSIGQTLQTNKIKQLVSLCCSWPDETSKRPWHQCETTKGAVRARKRVRKKPQTSLFHFRSWTNALRGTQTLLTGLDTSSTSMNGGCVHLLCCASADLVSWDISLNIWTRE